MEYMILPPQKAKKFHPDDLLTARATDKHTITEGRAPTTRVDPEIPTEADQLLTFARRGQNAEDRELARLLLQSYCEDAIGRYAVRKDLRNISWRVRRIAQIIVHELIYPDDKPTSAHIAKELGLERESYYSKMANGESWRHHVDYLREHWFTAFKYGRQV